MGARGRLILRVLRELAGFVRGRRRVYRVSGHSMAPTLQPGDVVAVERGVALPAPGDIVAVRDPERPGHVLVKRTRSRGDRTFAVGSDAPESGRDSRHFGSLSAEHLLGRAVWTWSKATGFRRPAASLGG